MNIFKRRGDLARENAVEILLNRLRVFKLYSIYAPVVCEIPGLRNRSLIAECKSEKGNARKPHLPVVRLNVMQFEMHFFLAGNGIAGLDVINIDHIKHSLRRDHRNQEMSACAAALKDRIQYADQILPGAGLIITGDRFFDQDVARQSIIGDHVMTMFAGDIKAAEDIGSFQTHRKTFTGRTAHKSIPLR